MTSGEWCAHDRLAGPDGADGGIADWRALGEAVAGLARRDAGGLPAWLREVKAAVDAGFRDPVTVQGLAGEAGVHPDHLTRAFRRCFGLRVGDYVRTRRVVWAARRLETTDRPIVDVALDAGFADQSHLTRSFKALLGVTPAALRRSRRRASQAAADRAGCSPFSAAAGRQAIA